MTLVLGKIKRGLDRSLELLVALTMAILVVDVAWQVFTRFVLKAPSSWTEELATFLMIWVGLLGASVALNRKAHLGVDYFVGKLSPVKRCYSEIAVFSCVALFSFFVLILGGGRLVSVTLMRGQISPALQLKMGYVYLALPISGFFLVLYSVEFAVGSIKALFALKRSGLHAP